MLKSRCGSETVEEDELNQSVENMVMCLVGGIEGVTDVSLSGRIANVGAGLDKDAEVNVAVMVSAVVRRRVPARVLGL
jgi:hypothetical protein